MAKTRAVIYTRFSPRRNAEECESCETQHASCTEYCIKQGYKVVGSFEDKDYSGDDADRPGIWAAIESLKKNMVLVVHVQDRLARSVYLEELLRRQVDKKGARVESAQGNNGNEPHDVLVRQILAAFGEYEKKIIALRTKYAMLRHQRNGRLMGSVAPYGWQIDPENPKRIIKDDHEQKALKRIAELRKEGVHYRDIAKILDSEGYRARKGRVVIAGKRRLVNRKWSHVSVFRIHKRQERQ